MESILKTAVVKDRYEEAYLASALMAACQSGYLKTPNMAAYQARMGTQNSRGAYQEEMAPAQFRYLAPGEEVGVMSPAYPNGQYDPYQTSLINQFAAGTGLPSAWISKDFSRYNYSSQRAADLQGRKVIRRLQRLVVKGFCLPSWGLVQEEAYLRGRLSAPAFYDDRRAWTSSMWIPPGWEWVSPSEEAKASRDSMEIGTSSEIEECATQGKDWEQVLKDQARVKRKREELDLADWRDAEKPAPPAPVIQQVKPDSPDDTPEADKPPVADRTEDEVQEVDK